MNKENCIFSGGGALLLADFFSFLEPLKWLALCGLILVFADLRFGIMAAIKRGEKIRTSRAVRRSINKMVDYTFWVLLAAALQKAFGVAFDVPFIPAVVMLVVYGIEINSCFANYFEYHDLHYKVDIFKWFKKKADIIEVEQKKEENK